ncbi:MAG: hypothetical protein V4819_10080 [Verrucomicrobiota bacterium]
MNTNPDEATLALWLDDELTGEELASVEAWAASRPEQIASREATRRWRATMAAAIPASEEPPYPEFFNSRVLQAIREQKPKAAVARKSPLSWNSWWMPMAACAGMAMAFWVGKNSQKAPEYDVSNAPRAILVEPVVYTPETGVKAEWIASSKASATVVVLNGITAIPDSMDFSETVYVPMDSEFDSTAGSEAQPELEVGP